MSGHKDLRVFQAAYSLAMEIFNLSKIFRRKKNILSPTRFAARPEASPSISLKVIGKDSIRKCLSTNFLIQIEKQRKRKFG